MTKEEAIETIKDICLTTEQLTRIEKALECLLSEPSLPSNLDEAAEEYAYNNWEDNDYHTGASEGLPFDAIGHTEKCFKAGAEWMARQGVSMEITPDVDWTDVDKFVYKNSGDNVIIQIRKLNEKEK